MTLAGAAPDWVDRNGVGWRLDGVRHHNRKQQRRLELHYANLPAGSYAFTATDTTSAGTSAASSAFDVTVNAPPPVTIQAGGTVELSQAYAGSVTFNGSTGTLTLDNPSTFSGEIFNFTGNGRLSGSDRIDLKGINFNSVRDSYANGVLTVTDGSGDTAKLHFNGSYALANFKFASDGHGGTIVYDPPVPGSSILTPKSLKGTDLPRLLSTRKPRSAICRIAIDRGYTIAHRPPISTIALLGSYMASSFAMAGGNHGGTIVAGEALESHHPLLTGPQHA